MGSVMSPWVDGLGCPRTCRLKGRRIDCNLDNEGDEGNIQKSGLAKAAMQFGAPGLTAAKARWAWLGKKLV